MAQREAWGDLPWEPRNYAFPRLGYKRLSDVTSAEALAVLAPIWAEKAVTAKPIRQRINPVMQRGIAQGWRADDPADGVIRVLPKQSTAKDPRKALPYEAMPEFIRTMQACDAGPTAKPAIEFAVLTATRAAEVREARWSWVDLERGLGGPSQPHEVGQGPSLAILQAWPPTNDRFHLQSRRDRRGGCMPKTRHSPEEIVAKLRQVDVRVSQGRSLAEAIRSIGVAEAT